MVTSDVFNPPGRRPEGKYIPHARFVHHLLIKLTHATRRALTTGDEHAKHAAVWNRARIGHRHALRARPRRHYPRDAVVDHTRAQLSKISRRIHTRNQVNDGVKDLPRQVAVRPRAGDGVIPVISGQAFWSGSHSRDGVLRQDVQGVGGDMQLFDASFHHLLHHHRGLQKVSPVLGVKSTMAGGADDVPGAPDPLQARGHCRWRFHLDDKLNGTHIDAQFQRTSGYDSTQRTLFKHRLSHRAFIFRHRAVMRSRDHSRGFAGNIHVLHQLRWVTPKYR